MPVMPAEPLSAQALAEAERSMADPRLTQRTKEMIAFDLFPHLVFMARAALSVENGAFAIKRSE